MNLPFDGAITKFYETEAPQDVRAAVAGSGSEPYLSPDFPYKARMKKKTYNERLYALQLELAKLQADVRETGKRIVVVFEGIDASGKGGTIKRFRENLNPRVARVVALTKPTEKESGEWYFQRYVEHLPSTGEIVLFDRSWYNRAVVEHVFGFCTTHERAVFFRHLPRFETLLIDEGIHFFKLGLHVGRAEQLRRFLARERDPLKQWKLSRIDVEGLQKWDEYAEAFDETYERSHTPAAPWTIIRTDDKRRARLAAIQSVVSKIDYARKDTTVATPPDPQVAHAPDGLDA